MVSAPSDKVSRVSSYSGYRYVFLTFAYGTFTLFGWSSQSHSASLKESRLRSEPRSARTSVWALPISLAATFGSDVSVFSSGYLDVSVHRVPGLYLWIQYRSLEVCSSRFPHSEISGSQDICSSPKLIAAYHVFHRLLVPRHPPCALIRLTNRSVSFFRVRYRSPSIALLDLVFSLLYLSLIQRVITFVIHLDVLSYLISVFDFQGSDISEELSLVHSYKSGSHLLSHIVSNIVPSAA